VASRQAVTRVKLCDAIRELTSRRGTGHDEEYIVGKLNQKLVGWTNYFSVGTVTKAYGVVNYHVTNRLRRWLCAKHKVRGPGYSRYPDAFLCQKLGLYQLRSERPSLPNASA
jgi:RNA-directed DNA polymerase